jgi:hypothetical protein
MIKDEQLPELAVFRTLEANLPLWYTPKYGSLVVASGNDSHPIHRWFRFKEGFSADLLESLLSSLDIPRGPEQMLLDPFCGSGTTLLSAANLREKGWNFRGVGIEVNPFIAFVARTKANWFRISPQRMNSLGEAALSASKNMRTVLPELTSISEGRCISRATARRLIGLRDAINQKRSSPNRDAALLGIAASIEPLSKVRKDGRALRLVSRPRLDFEDTIRAKWQEIAADVVSLKHPLSSPLKMAVVQGDGRIPQKSGILPNSVDLIVTSPPYPNNIDYTEVYKLELWIMGFIDSSEHFLAQRRRTVRSHPTSAALPQDSPFLNLPATRPILNLLQPLLQRMERSNDLSIRRLLLGYCADLFEALSNHFVALRPGGHEVLVVGNSLHGSGDTAFLLPSDLLIASMAPLIGFEVMTLNIARSLKRRLTGNHFLRESVVVLRKPNA